MAFTPRSEEEAAQAITRLVDGTLGDGERAAVEAWAEANPEVSRQVLAQREIARELSVAGPPVPARLLDTIGQRVRTRRGLHELPAGGPPVPPHLIDDVQESPRASRGSRPGAAARGGRAWALSGWRPAAAVGAAAAAVLAIVLVVVLVGGSGSSPSITAAAKLAYVPATQPAPGVRDAKYLDVSYGGVTFPNYAGLHAVATGKLTNTIDGRPAVTVFYRLSDGTRLSYTVFSGSPVPLPAAARRVLYGPDYQYVPLDVYRTRDELSVVTLVRNGRTCVLAARTGEDVVLGLAAEPILAA